MAKIVGYGVNGDPLHESTLDLPELLEVLTPEECSWARHFISLQKWREAVTYRETAPHEYTIRTWEAGGFLTNGPPSMFTKCTRRRWSRLLATTPNHKAK